MQITFLNFKLIQGDAVKFDFGTEWEWNTNRNNILLNLDFGITERIDHLFGGQGMTQEQVDEAENQEENLQSRLQNNKNFLSTLVA